MIIGVSCKQDKEDSQLSSPAILNTTTFPYQAKIKATSYQDGPKQRSGMPLHIPDQHLWLAVVACRNSGIGAIQPAQDPL